MLTDRDAFGHWLSGFTDGEGNFHITRHGKMLKNGPSNGFQVAFRLNLRVDDQEILERVRDYFGCGNLYYWTHARGNPNDNPQVKLQIASAPVLADVVVPHFDRYPLRSKKAVDYKLWREAVLRIYEIQQRPRVGSKPRWMPEDVAAVLALKERISAVRAFTLTPPVASCVLLADA